jgi:ABC-2 type transport system ATP-binding protein
MTAEPIVSVRGARRRYGAFEAVRGVDLEVRRGELVALLGTNGAGKTSLVELVEGLAPADGGERRTPS